MKKVGFVVLLLLVAAASSAATVGVMKFMKGGGGDIVILSDKRCAECDTSRIEASLKRNFPAATFKQLDYGDRKGKKLYESEDLKMLPAVLLPKSMEGREEFQKIQRFTQMGKDYYVLKSPGQFDPTAEICDNNKDDTGNGLTDCKDPSCKSDWRCMEKKDKPEVDVFVMSHCPYGTQMEKGLLPVWDLLGDKIDLNIRYVDYAMHGEKEIKEQLNQYCVQQQGKGKFRKYLECFLKEGKGDECLKETGVDSDKLAECVKASDKKFAITENFNKKNTWKGRFPPFGIYAEKAQKYGVRGSPTLVVNDVVVSSGRSPQAILDAVCTGFKNPPEQCKKKLSSASPSPGFGFGKDRPQGAGEAKCGG